MRQSLFFARTLLWVAALVLASPLASAAPKRGKAKPKHTAPAPSEASSLPETSDKAPDPAPPKPAESAPAKPEPPPAAPESTQPSAPKAPSAGGEAGVALAADTAEVEDSSKSSHEALGRLEAARLAAGRSEVGVYVGVDIGNRRFKYSDPVSSALRPYTLPIAPMLSVGLEAYPLAATDLPVLRDLGFRGRLSRAFALDSTTPEGATIETSWTRFGGEVRERLLIPGKNPLELGAFFGADASYFVMGSKSTVGAVLPSARTISLRFGLDGRVLIAGRFSAMLDLAYLAVTSPGYIYDQFRDPEVAGIDGGVGCAVALIPGLEARLLARYTRYFSTFHPEVGDPYVAGGALDEQLQVGVGVRYAH